MAVTRKQVWVEMLLYPAHTLPTAAAPVAVAMGLAAHDRVLAVGPALLALLAGWLVQLGGVFTDNYYNLSRHPDDEEHAQFVEAVNTGVITLAELRRAIFATFGVAVLAGLYLIGVAGLPVLYVGLASIAGALSYSAGPFPLGDHGLGDPLFFVFFGLVSVGATYYVQAAARLGGFPLWFPPGTVPLRAIVAGLPVAALTTCILVIDNIRDLEYDRNKGERTLAVIIGPRWSRVEYTALMLFAYTVPVWFWLRAGFGPFVLLPCATLPLALSVAARVWRSETHAEMIPLTPAAGRVVLIFSLLFAFGLSR
ncbi:MAG: 1,4-dihydroxy-2-naphthoate octaprenyltransferase [Myxococcales bacterium]|nr:1,4-dihydroxy-2-naphthoate octaprenyltransferase [Myxococcales bacterium]